jgi:ATP-dependent DNA helicase UvrD/PcrA
MDRLAGLNPSQRDAVTTLSGPLLVLAGAGTGKTRVITYRIAELIRHGVDPSRILSVTFTNKAAREMQQRTMELLGKRRQVHFSGPGLGKRGQVHFSGESAFRKRRVNPKNGPVPFVSTFHSFCVRLLRQEITALGYPANFVIYDRGDQESAARTALRDVRVTDKAMQPGDLLNVISRWKMAGVGPDRAAGFAENDRDFLASVAFRRYQQNLKTCGAVDFDDLLLLANRLLADFPDVRRRHQARFDHVQIDEYQDTNGVQFQLVQSLVEPHGNLCVVGDDDQSIYAWRGASVEHILRFESHFPGTKVVRLQDNYRCTDRILDLANRLVRHNRDRHDKVLVSHKPSHAEVRFLEFPDEQAEAENVVREIKYHITQQNVPAADFAVLFRTNEQPRLFEAEFRRAGMRYVLLGSQSFFDRKEVRDILAYLKAIALPHDEISLLRIINTPARGISKPTVEKLLERAVRQKQRLWDALPDAVAAGDVASKAATAVEQFRDLLNDFRRRFEQSPRRLDECIRELIDDVGYSAEIQKQYKQPEQQLARMAILDQFVDSASLYLERAGNPSLTGFLDEVSLVGRDEQSDKDDRLQEQAVKLMTLHSAKGLEFPRVYLVGLEEGLLPHRRSVEGTDNDIAEERRLLYVGITRAMDELTITRAASRMKWGKRRPTIPSRFLFEMREEL